jgi:hypothetical protein
MTKQDATAAADDSAVIAPIVRQWKRSPKKVKAAPISFPLTATIGFYQHRKQIRAHVRIPAHVAILLGPTLEGGWRLERARVIDVLANRFVDGWTLVRDERGFKFYWNGRGLLGRPRDVTSAKKINAEKMELTPNANGFVAGPINVAANDNTPVGGKRAKPLALLVDDRFRLLPKLAALSSDPGGKLRDKFLANDNNRKVTTKAGDQCYTPRFIIDAVLDAAGKLFFALDACAMVFNGRYDLNLPNGVQTSTKGWGRTPPRLRFAAKVVGHVPALRYFTNDAIYGSLARDWPDFVWCNPPYSRRVWAAFLEKANLEVELGNAKLVVTLVPIDDTGEHTAHIFGRHAHRIALVKQLPFFKREKVVDGVAQRDFIEVTRGNQFVIFGKGEETRDFLMKLCTNLLALEYISQAHYDRYMERYAVDPRLNP